MQKLFKPTYLYVKTHNITGLKYFGKTTSRRNRYRGSGKYWRNHIKKHGYDVTTEIVGYFKDEKECMNFAIKFSIDNDIVNSSEWANERIENGVDGGDTFSYRTEEEKRKINEKRKLTYLSKTEEELELINKRNSEGVKKFVKENYEARLTSARKGVETRRQNGKLWHSDKTKENIKNNNKSGTIEVREKISKTLTGRKNPEHSKRMTGRTGIKCPNTRIFKVTTPTGIYHEIIGCVELNKFCLENSLPYKQLIKHINRGKITQVDAKKVYGNMTNVLGYEIIEVKNEKRKKV